MNGFLKTFFTNDPFEIRMQDLETLEKIENQLNFLTLDNDETTPLEATKTIKKKIILSKRQIEGYRMQELN